MNLADLDKLKDLVATSKDLSKPFTYFMDHFGENDAFLGLGKPKPHPVLEGLLSATAGQLFGAKVVIKQMMLIKVPKTHFIHGAGLINGRLANVIYFEDIEVGMAAFAPSPGAPVQFTRFSARALPPEGVPSRN